jgi:hypothetical protein
MACLDAHLYEIEYSRNDKIILSFTTQKITFIIKTVIMMTINYGLQFFFFFELTDNDGQNFLAGMVLLGAWNFGQQFVI